MPAPLLAALGRWFVNFLRNQLLNVEKNFLKSREGIQNRLKSEESPPPPKQPDTSLTCTGDREAIKMLEGMQMDISRTLRPCLKRQASAVCYDFLRNTPPKSVANGESRVSSEVSKLFKPIQRVPFGHLVMNKDWESVNSYGWMPSFQSVRDEMETGDYERIYARFQRRGWVAKPYPIFDKPEKAYHMSQRDARTGLIGKSPRTAYVRNPSSIDEYKKQVATAVGKMGSGWWDCIKQLGKPADGQFAPHNGFTKSRGIGKVKQTLTGNSPSISVENPLGNFANLLGSKMPAILSRRENLFRQDMEREVERAIAKNQAKAP